MKTSEFIARLRECIEQNGDIDVVGIADGDVYKYIDVNVEEYGKGHNVVYVELAEY